MQLNATFLELRSYMAVHVGLDVDKETLQHLPPPQCLEFLF